MKKRIISVLLATVFALSVIGCGTKDTKEQDAYRQYGITCMESGKYEDAVKAFQNALGESIGHIGEKELDICFCLAAQHSQNLPCPFFLLPYPYKDLHADSMRVHLYYI